MAKVQQSYGDFLELVIAHKIYHILNPYNQKKFLHDEYKKSDTPFGIPQNRFNPDIIFKVGLNKIIRSNPKNYILNFNGEKINDTVQTNLILRTRITNLMFFKTKNQKKYNSIINIDISNLRQIQDIIKKANQYLLDETKQQLIFTIEMTGIDIFSSIKTTYKKADLIFNLNVKYKGNITGDNHKYSITIKLSDSSLNKKIQQGQLDGSFKDDKFSKDKMKPLLEKLFFEVDEIHKNLDQEYINFNISGNEIHTISKPTFFKKIDEIELNTIQISEETVTSLLKQKNNIKLLKEKNKIIKNLFSNDQKRNLFKKYLKNIIFKGDIPKPLFISVNSQTENGIKNILVVRLENRYYFAAIKYFSFVMKELLDNQTFIHELENLSNGEVKKFQDKQKQFEKLDLNSYIYEYGDYIKDIIK